MGPGQLSTIECFEKPVMTIIDRYIKRSRIPGYKLGEFIIKYFSLDPGAYKIAFLAGPNRNSDRGLPDFASSHLPPEKPK